MKRWTMVLIAGLLLFSLACAALGGGSRATEAPSAMEETGGEAPAATEETGGEVPEATPELTAEDETLPQVSADALEGFDSYRSKFTMRQEFDDGTVQELYLLQEAIREPYATRTVMESTGAEEDAGRIEMIQIGNIQYVLFGEQWMQSEVTETDQGDFAEDSMIDYNDIMDGFENNDYDYLGRETINGVRTKHYRLKFGAMQLESLGVANVTDASSEVWIADEAGLPAFTVRFTLEYRGEIESDRTGKVTMMQDVYDVNKNFTIEPPAEALAGSLPEDVPMYPGGTELTMMSDMVSFKAPDDAATVTAFYDEALAQNGWEKNAESFMPTWEKEGRQLQLYISDEDGGGSSVVIILGTKE